jgi:DNA invertase Pin-like site-specific DNA recombinase
MMPPKITPEQLGRGAVVSVRQSTMGQVAEHTESQRRQYALAEWARSLRFASVTVIDDDLGRSGFGLAERPGFQKRGAAVCSGLTGAVFCIAASRLARNGRDGHYLIDLCALVGTLVVDPDGTYDPRLVKDRVLLGLKGTMSEDELSLLRQRGIVPISLPSRQADRGRGLQHLRGRAPHPDNLSHVRSKLSLRAKRNNPDGYDAHRTTFGSRHHHESRGKSATATGEAGSALVPKNAGHRRGRQKRLAAPPFSAS